VGFDYRVRFDDPRWYPAHRTDVLERARGIPCAVPVHDVPTTGAWKPTDTEIWLSDPADGGGSDDWPYDVRVFVRDELSIEVTRFTEAYASCLRHLVVWIQQQTSATLVDDDGDPASWPRP
jgi:hypothetical protein